MTVDSCTRNGFKWSHRAWNVHLDIRKFSFYSSGKTTFDTKLSHQEQVLPGLIQYLHTALWWRRLWRVLKTSSLEELIKKCWVSIRFISLKYASSVANMRKMFNSYAASTLERNTRRKTASVFMIDCLLLLMPTVMWLFHVTWRVRQFLIRFCCLHEEMCIRTVTPGDSVLKYPLRISDTEASRFAVYLHQIPLDSCKQAPYPVRNCAVFQWKRRRVNAANVFRCLSEDLLH